ncbi:HlyD family type I secretion periplasmic adaptor subunit [Maritimibacter sp. DP1N21-5]|uniref:HlyD family type I secretion periplasmic adaptor subunit n=1 Tax=Maritimibacter sp. DP1N21-5 TaxID=2836867 RepID=UPI001C48D452|nr:HlyD family type I secretion periplasmic adaptor subunit [Maritimibacter sp. DP1N21-5]MBV7407549.1 HlyD family type I secretion periplasmic adaptor subunit [Maritimibacter sp. DP1N21-5]
MTEMTMKQAGPSLRLGLGWPIAISGVLMVALVAGLGSWAMEAKLNAAVIASGNVQVDRELRTAQHAEGGTISEILVLPGQEVAKGDPLVKLETHETESELAILRMQLREARAQAARFEAEREGWDALAAPAGADAADVELVAAMAGEMMLLDNERQERTARKRALALQSERLLLEEKALKSRRDALLKQLELANEALERNTELVARGAVAESRLTESASAQARLTGDFAEVEARLMTNRVEQSRVELEMSELDTAAVSNAHKELRVLTPKIAELQLQILSREDLLARSVVRAPVAGTVNQVPVNTIGQVVAPGQTMVTIVPRDAKLVIEFKVATTDIDQIALGQAARLRFLAFDQRLTPEFDGVVSHIAPASVTDQAAGASFYLANAEPVENIELPHGARLVPGMPVEVYLTTRERSPFDYIVQPIRDSMSRAMTEW